MLVYEAKLQETLSQYRIIDDMLRTGLFFVINLCVTGWTIQE
ncbi:hypothetical protein [Aerosakkonema funiforme]